MKVVVAVGRNLEYVVGLAVGSTEKIWNLPFEKKNGVKLSKMNKNNAKGRQQIFSPALPEDWNFNWTL